MRWLQPTSVLDVNKYTDRPRVCFWYGVDSILLEHIQSYRVSFSFQSNRRECSHFSIGLYFFFETTFNLYPLHFKQTIKSARLNMPVCADDTAVALKQSRAKWKLKARWCVDIFTSLHFASKKLGDTVGGALSWANAVEPQCTTSQSKENQNERLQSTRCILTGVRKCPAVTMW